MKRYRRGEMLEFLRSKGAIGATSEQMGKGREFLSRVLAHDPDAYLSTQATDEILDAYESVKEGLPTA